MTDLRSEVEKLLAETHQELEESKRQVCNFEAEPPDGGAKALATRYRGESAALKRMVVKLQRVLETS